MLDINFLVCLFFKLQRIDYYSFLNIPKQIVDCKKYINLIPLF